MIHYQKCILLKISFNNNNKYFLCNYTKSSLWENAHYYCSTDIHNKSETLKNNLLSYQYNFLIWHALRWICRYKLVSYISSFALLLRILLRRATRGGPGPPSLIERGACPPWESLPPVGGEGGQEILNRGPYFIYSSKKS